MSICNDGIMFEVNICSAPLLTSMLIYLQWDVLLTDNQDLLMRICEMCDMVLCIALYHACIALDPLKELRRRLVTRRRYRCERGFVSYNKRFTEGLQ